MINPITFLLDFFYELMKMAQSLWNWLFNPVSIGTWTFRPILIIGGSMLLILLGARLIKQFVPMV